MSSQAKQWVAVLFITVFVAVLALLVPGCAQDSEKFQVQLQALTKAAQDNNVQVQGHVVLRPGGVVRTETYVGVDAYADVFLSANPAASRSTASLPAGYDELVQWAMDRGFMPKDFVAVAQANDVKFDSQ